MTAEKTKTPLGSAVLGLVLASRSGSIVIPTAPAAEATVAKLPGTVRRKGRGVKPQLALEDGEAALQVREEVLEVLDSHRKPYESVG
jgi:hypothetical protein